MCSNDVHVRPARPTTTKWPETARLLNNRDQCSHALFNTAGRHTKHVVSFSSYIKFFFQNNFDRNPIRTSGQPPETQRCQENVPPTTCLSNHSCVSLWSGLAKGQEHRNMSGGTSPDVLEDVFVEDVVRDVSQLAAGVCAAAAARPRPGKRQRVLNNYRCPNKIAKAVPLAFNNTKTLKYAHQFFNIM